MKKINKFIYWLFKISYQFSVVKHKNLPINAVFFVSFIYTNFINFILNITLFTYFIDKLNAYYYLVVLLIVSVVAKVSLLKKEIIDEIPKTTPTRNDVIKLYVVFFISVILFFGSLAMIT
ncbi:hypothetical protein [Flavobacterium sp.]|uniref:hypothetical protein n=2 Tax=Flavobacterium sp. TaxID=239 RepID=UPI0040487C4B